MIDDRTGSEAGTVAHRPTGGAPATEPEPPPDPEGALTDVDGPGPEATRKRRGSAWKALESRPLRYYIAGNACSNLGSWFQNTAQILLAYQLSGGSAFVVGLVTCVQFLPSLVAGPWAGALADRFDRRRMLITVHVTSAAVSGGAAALLAWTDSFGIGLLVASALLTGVMWTLAYPALSALAPTLVPDEHAKAAMTLSTVSNNVGRALAPVLSVVAIAWQGFAWSYLVNAFSYMVMAAVLLAIRVGTVERSGPRPRARDGWALLHRSPVRLLVAVGALATFTTDPPTVLGPSLAEHFGKPASWGSAYLMALGLGMVAASFRPYRAQPSLTSSAGAIATLGLSVFCMAITPWFALSLAVTVLAGAAYMVAIASAQTLLLGEVDKAETGRIMAVWTIAFAGSRPIASVIDGRIADTVGTTTACMLLAVPALGYGAFVFVKSHAADAAPEAEVSPGGG